MPGILLDRVSRKFAGVWAVFQLDLEVQREELFVLLGPSGCGKTTTLRLIAGLDSPTEGEIYIAGRSVQGLSPRQRDVGMAFQHPALFPHLTVRENLQFGSHPERTPKHELDMTRLTGELGIDGLLDRWPEQLSGGERQRVALGRALASRAGVMLLDEPLSNLDAGTRWDLRRVLRRLIKDMASTALIVTHDQAEAMAMADRVGIMDRGSLIQVGAPQELYEQPADAFVARFIGRPPINLFTGLVEAGPEGAAFVAGDVRIPLGMTARIPRVEGTKVQLGFRPEHVELLDPLAEEPAAVGPGEVDGIVRNVEVAGSMSSALIDVGDGYPARAGAKRTGVECRVKSGRRIAVGERVRCRVDLRWLHWFDAQTGRRLNPVQGEEGN